MSLLSPFSLSSFALFSFLDFFSFLKHSSAPLLLSPPLFGTGEEELAVRGSLGGGGGQELEVLSLPLVLLLVPMAGLHVVQLATLGDAGLRLSLAASAPEHTVKD